jgi:hypothetical protein
MDVALSILEKNTLSLVGVAILASLLLPAVNAGICWAKTGGTANGGAPDGAASMTSRFMR